MSEDKAKEIIAENVAKEVVESIGEDLAGALVEYANLVFPYFYKSVVVYAKAAVHTQAIPLL